MENQLDKTLELKESSQSVKVSFYEILIVKGHQHIKLRQLVLNIVENHLYISRKEEVLGLSLEVYQVDRTRILSE